MVLVRVDRQVVLQMRVTRKAPLAIFARIRVLSLVSVHVQLVAMCRCQFPTADGADVVFYALVDATGPGSPQRRLISASPAVLLWQGCSALQARRSKSAVL